MLRPFTDDVWIADMDQAFYGLQFGARMTLVRLSDGTLFMHSPIAIDAAMKAEIDALGPVGHIVAPNIYHHVHATPAMALYPDAKVHVASGLKKKRPDLRADAVLAETADAGWQGDLEPIPIDGYMLNETVFVHHPSGTLICSDLLENFESSDDWYTRTFLKLNGVYGKTGVSRVLRFAYPDKRAARRCVDQVLEHPFERIALAHGTPISSGGRDALRTGYAWLHA